MASHIIGGEMYYDYLGNYQYKISIVIYRDCASSGADFDNPLSLAIYTSSGNLYQNVSVVAPPSTILPIEFDNPCVKKPSGFCNERAIYTKIVTLPPRAGGYYLAYQRCCRTPNVVNINNPGNTGLTLTVHIPTNADNQYENSSPRFTNYPPLVLCNNQTLKFDHSATDPDADELVYDLYAPFAGASTTNPQPNQAPPPPYQPIFWANGFTAANPFGAGASVSIDANTGLLTVDPNLQGMFVVGVRVREYRNGVLLSTVIRDFIFQVISCNVTLEAKIVPQNQLPGFIDVCQGTSVNFKNNSYGGTTYDWDFGVPDITTDVSNQFAPSYTYPGPGEYTVTLVVNKGMPCSDSTTQIFKVYEELNLDFTHDDSLCLNDNSFDFSGTYSGPTPPTFSWDFGPNTTQTSNDLNVSNVHFNTAGNQTIKLTAKHETCTKTVTKSVFVVPQPTADFTIMQDSECAGLTQNFTNQSTNATNYTWNFGDNTTATDANPEHTYGSPGNYTVTLIANAGTHCLDSVSRAIVINEALVVDFTFGDSLCITNPSTEFVAHVDGPGNHTLQWNFGNTATPSNATQDTVSVTYNQSGVFPVRLTASLESCSISKDTTITIFKSPSIGFTFVDRLYCTPAVVDFINQSSSQTPLTYSWDLGNGQTATTKNATGIYEDSGVYSVSLTIISTVGCIDTLTLTKENLFKVNPAPTADFSLSRDTVTICDSKVDFIDASIDAIKYVYIFDEDVHKNFDANPSYEYTTSGMKYPYQIVENEFGCKDTARLAIYVEPFSIFIPNAFSPNGDKLNDEFYAVPTLPVRSWDFMIFNKWGELIYQMDDFTQKWDGKYKNEIVPIGTYTYILEAVSCEKNKPEKLIKGHVNVVR